MQLQKTLKTYPDGSKFTTTHVVVLTVITVAVVGVSSAVSLKLDARRQKKIMEKAVATLNDK